MTNESVKPPVWFWIVSANRTTLECDGSQGIP